MEVEHARLLQQGWRLATDGCYRKPEPGKITGLPGNDANTGLKNPTAESNDHPDRPCGGKFPRGQSLIAA
jgi:hypothetical protein